MSQMMKPNSGRRITRTVHNTLRSVEAPLWKMLTMAQMSATSKRMLHRLLWP